MLEPQPGIRIVLISAPSGFGKTSLMADWIHRAGEHVAWLTLDERDNDPLRFLKYLVSAYLAIDESIGKKAMGLLTTAPIQDTTQVLTLLLNDLEQRADAVTLILDDYHLITSEDVHEAMRFLLTFAPNNAHIILATRSDPPLPLARLRAHRQIVEIHAADLQLNASTVGTLSQIAGLALSTQVVNTLVARTEGWATGVQLALLSLQNRQGAVDDFIGDFSGSHQHILAYFEEEILLQQPPSVQTFLMRTSILDYLQADLCARLTNDHDSAGILERLKHSNLFIEQLDDHGKWYRYHRLFRDFLRNRLEQSAEDTTELYRRVVAWYLDRSAIEDAIDYAIKGKLFDDAVYLLTQCGDGFIWNRIGAFFLLTAIEALPPETIQNNPLLSLIGARALFNMERPLEQVESYMERVHANLESTNAASVSPIIEKLTIREMHMMEAELALSRGNEAAAWEAAQRAMDYIDPEDSLERATLYQLQGYIALRRGHAHEANQRLTDASLLARDAQASSTYRFAMTDNAAALLKQGRLDIAAATYRRLLTDLDGYHPFAEAVVRIGLGQVHYERHQLADAEESTRRGLAIAEEFCFQKTRRQGHLVLAYILAAQGDGVAALRHIREAIALAETEGIEQVSRQLAAHQAQINLLIGKKEPAMNWADSLDSGLLRFDTPIDYAQEFELVAYARIHAAVAPEESLVPLLTRLIAQAEEHGRQRDVIEDRLILAGMVVRLGQPRAAREILENALKKAIPAGYRQIIINEGSILVPLLRDMAGDGIFLSPIQEILAAIDDNATPPQPGDLAEALSDRELQVLRLVALGMSNRDIADHLVVGLTTVKSHVSSIIAKLGARNRTEAVALARDQNII
ncbi:MAG: LuxR C-terminal-related transcriptional regulator, partial [Anaerolineae bacterium]|nr:LuxR C-terminal-related transcriptional regulator [Anaerolineae bacterium]